MRKEDFNQINRKQKHTAIKKKSKYKGMHLLTKIIMVIVAALMLFTALFYSGSQIYNYYKPDDTESTTTTE